MLRHVATVVIAASTGCEGAATPETEWFGDRVELATTRGAVPCAGTLDHYDRFIAGLEALVGVTREDRIPVFYLDSESFSELAPCPAGVKGCTETESGTVYLLQHDVLEHELVHAVITPALGLTDHVFSEGLAEALGPTPGRRVPSLAAADPLAMIGLDADEIDYGAAAHFISYLVRRGGMPKFMELYKRASPQRREETLALLESVYATTSEEMRQDFAQEAAHCPLTSFACGLVNDSWQVPVGGAYAHTTIGCEAWPSVGFFFPGPEPLFPPDFRLTFRASIESGGEYLLDTSDGLALSACGPCVRGVGVDLQNASTLSVQLDAGDYLAEVRSNDDPAHEWRLELVPHVEREESDSE